MKKYHFQQPEMGSLFRIVMYATDSIAARNAAQQTFALIDTLNSMYSDYLPGSELNRLCAAAGTGAWVHVSFPLLHIVQQACAAGRASHGAFDITLGPVVRLWRRARKANKLPDADSLRNALQLVGYRRIHVDAMQQSIRLDRAGMQLDLGGIAQGDAARRAYLRLCALGFPYSLVDAAGDIVAGDVPPQVAGWRVAINLPGSETPMPRQLQLRNMSVTTSGDLYQHLTVNGVRYSHIIDPATGQALTNARNVTVISGDGATADWLTKACSIMPVSEALRFIRQFPGTEVQIAVLKKGRPVFYRSAGFRKYFRN